jgi:hypothetical protein
LDRFLVPYSKLTVAAQAASVSRYRVLISTPKASKSLKRKIGYEEEDVSETRQRLRKMSLDEGVHET